MAMLNELSIECFRGIRNLTINELRRINLVVGDNNCGKTSVMEAIQLLRTAKLPGNLYRIARQRESLLWRGSNYLYESLVCMFPHDGTDRRIHVSGNCDGNYIACSAKGEEHRIIIDAKELSSMFIRRNADWTSTETDEFIGEITYQYGEKVEKESLQLNRYSVSSGTVLSEANTLRIIYVSPFEHLRGSIMNQIIKNEQFKQICLKALQLFDPEIEDMLILKNEISNRPVEYLQHARLGNMPLSTFGDGIKKVLVLSNAIVKAAGGILLIDEIETALHKKYYDDFFRFIVKASEAFDVQIFITTHSLEAIDGLLATQDYDFQTTKDNISVVTLKRDLDTTYSRVLAGREVARNREEFGFEVRL